MENNKSHSLCDAILHYLQRYPNAADTPEGIMNWWVSKQELETDADEIEQALDQLVTDGLIKRIFLVDGTVIFKCSSAPEKPHFL